MPVYRGIQVSGYRREKSFADRKEDCVYEESASTGKKGDIVGEAQYLLDGKVIGKTDIVAAKSVKRQVCGIISNISERE